jgi:hypothetical protein
MLCLAHATNTMGQSGQDLEKGEADGPADALRVLQALVAPRRSCADPASLPGPFPQKPPNTGPWNQVPAA